MDTSAQAPIYEFPQQKHIVPFVITPSIAQNPTQCIERCTHLTHPPTLHVTKTTSWETPPQQHAPALETTWNTITNNALPSKTLVRYEAPHTSSPHEVPYATSVTYKDVVSLRNRQDILRKIPRKHNPFALSIVVVPLSSDGFVILGKKPFFGDWPSHTYELAGGFIRHEELSPTTTLTKLVHAKIADDYAIQPTECATLRPIVRYHFPAICEVQILFAVQATLSSTELIDRGSKHYENVIATPLQTALQCIPLQEWHPPSYVALATYENKQ